MINYKKLILNKKADVEERNDMGQTYKEWKVPVDALISSKFGLGMDDFADWPSYDAFMDNLGPEASLEEFLNYQDF